MATIVGTANADNLNGTNGDDEFFGGGGNDSLNGLDGNDLFRWFSGDGNDTIDGGNGTDWSLVTLTNNTGLAAQQYSLVADPAGSRTTFFEFGTGTAGNPKTLVNSLRNVELFQLTLSSGSDFNGANIRIGNLAGTDMTGVVEIENLSASGITVNATETNNVVHLNGGSGNDILLAGNANDSLYGFAGDDVLLGGGGFNEMAGGTGNDTYRATAADTLIENAGEGTDTVVTSDASFTLGANLENLLFAQGAGATTNFTGIGNALNNYLAGGAGADYLIGLDGDDILAGGSGAANTLQGGPGNDSYVVSVAGDTIVENAGEGNDTVQTSLTSYVLAANLENLFFNGSGAFSGTGNANANLISGAGGNDVIRGLDANDVLFGNAGNDVLVGGNGSDLLIGGAGADELAGGAGTDIFRYTAQSDRPDLIDDFSRAEGDKIDVAQLLASVGAVGDPFGNGFLRVQASSFGGQPSTDVFFDADGTAGPGGEILLIQVIGSSPLASTDFLVT